MSWTLRFDPPIPLPGGGELATLREAGDYIAALPPDEQQHPEVQVAIHVLLQAADHSGPLIFARMGVLRMLARHEPPPTPSPIKRKRWRS